MKSLVSENLNCYEKLYQKKLNSDEVSEMKSNLTNFFKLLIEIDRKVMEERTKNEKAIAGFN